MTIPWAVACLRPRAFSFSIVFILSNSANKIDWAYLHINRKVSFPIPENLAVGTARSFYSHMRAVYAASNTQKTADLVEIPHDSMTLRRANQELDKFGEQRAGDELRNMFHNTAHRRLGHIHEVPGDNLECSGTVKPQRDEELKDWRQR